jgi:hypothetical protein
MIIMQAIEVKYFGPTNNRGSRWKATAAAGSVSVSYDYSLNSTDNAVAAAKALVDKFEWGNVVLHGGQLANGNYVFTVTNPRLEEASKAA